jgi:hypothetical protein
VKRLLHNPGFQRVFLFFSAYMLAIPTLGLPNYIVATYAFVLLCILCI